ncbi:MAG: hypothetical protein RLZZ76_369 [Candidatus Parcubacteria bacterium]|jgi:hypothetical protein
MKLSKQMRMGVFGIVSSVVLVGIFFFYTQTFVPQNEHSFLIGSDITRTMMDDDLEQLSHAEQTFEGTRSFFVDIAKKRGGVYAFELLKQAVLPAGTDLHLMGHAVGDELYKQVGLEGMQYCTHDFRNACSHSIVVGALLSEGLAVFDTVNDVCKKAPGGPGAYTMCFHGFGHGVLAFAEYELPEAVKLCGKVATDAYGREEEAQCIGGIVMEMHQGVHDKEIWERKKDKYLKQDEPLRICQSDYMPENAKVLCYSYITPFIFDAAGARGGNPTPDIYPQSFAYCDTVENDTYRQSCYGGLGKEFIVLSQDRDIRKIEDTPDELLMKSASWCALAEREEAETACLLSILDSLYWGGENDPEVSVRYCSLLAEGNPKQACFEHLFSITEYYQKDETIRASICKNVPASVKEQCEKQLLTI